jgi:hypothetical protein
MLKTLEGKKTYILAVLLGVVLLILVFLGKLTPGLAVEIVIGFAPGFAATFRDAIEKNQSQIVAVLTDVAKAGADATAHNYTALKSDALRGFADVATLAPAVSVQFTGPAKEVTQVVSALQASRTDIQAESPKVAN